MVYIVSVFVCFDNFVIYGEGKIFLFKDIWFLFYCYFCIKINYFKKKNMLIKRKIFCILIIGYVGCMYIEVWVV